MPRGNGGIIGPANIPTTSVAKGVWSLMEQQLAQRQGIWPAGPLGFDPYFEYTTLLLPGNGTNGAQNNTFLDGSTNSFTITRNGNTTQGTFSPFSQTGWGNYFDGNGDYLSVPNSTNLNSTGDFTIEGWAYITSASSYAGMFSMRASTGTTNGASITFINTGYIEFAVNPGGNNLTTPTPLNQWFHVALVRSGSSTNNCSCYLNGTRVAQFTSTSQANGASNGAVIGRYYADGTNQYWVTGYLSNVRYVVGTAVYSGATITVPTTPLTAISGTQVLTCQSNRFIDSSSNAFAVTVNGNPSVQAFSPFNPTASWSAATYGGSGYFDGSGDYLTAPANSAFAFGTGDMTFEAWAYYAGTQGTFSYVTDLRVSGSESTSRFYVYLSGTTLYLGFGSTDDINVATGISKDQWLHIAVVRSGSGSNNVAVFVNGTRTHQRTDTSNFSTNAIPKIGARYGNTDFITGYIGSYRIVKGTAVYDPSQSTITVPTAPLTAITNTSLLLNFTNAGIYDATSKNDLETVGNAQISTAQSKWGGSSMAFDGTGDYLLAPSSQYIAFPGDFTFECWLYRTASTGEGTLFYNTTSGGINIFMDVSGTWGIGRSGVAVDNNFGSTPSANTWNHIAVSRSGSTIKAFVNGTQVFSGTNTQSYVAGPFQVGLSAYGTITGYIQDLRITKGYARYTTNFTAPTAAFPTL